MLAACSAGPADARIGPCPRTDRARRPLPTAN